MKKFLTVLLVGCILFTACDRKQKQSENGVVTITFWHSFVASTILALEDLISQFEKEHPGIKINAQYVPTGDALIQKLITAIQSKTAPDISWIHSDFLADLVDADAIYEMAHFINGENGLSQEELSDIYPALMQYASLRKKIYSIPMEATNLALIYNKDLLRKAGYDAERPPQTWEELKEYALTLSEDYNHDGNYDQIGFFVPVYPASGPLSGWMMWQWVPYLWQAGGYIVNEAQTKVLYNSEAGVQALTLWKEIYNSLNLSSFTVDYDVAFASQRVAMSMDGPWNLPRFNKIMKNIDWAFAPLPEGPKKRATVVGGEYLVIFKQSPHPDESWAFIKWIIRPDVQARWAMKSGYLPVRQSVKSIPEFARYLEENPNFKVFVDQMEVAQAQRPLDNFGLQITRHIAEAIEAATLGGMDPQEALNRSAQKSNKLLKSVQNNK
ncbi:MAG: hypothetical protein DRP86_01995 [Candidatus Neomarinimicrobiota bacterium]|nr:MAG: hypothetical protein DRP86_01995 [Candidatus Neomarinimicrobiota bacterium]